MVLFYVIRMYDYINNMEYKFIVKLISFKFKIKLICSFVQRIYNPVIFHLI